MSPEIRPKSFETFEKQAPGTVRPPVSFAAAFRVVTQCSSPTNGCSLELCIQEFTCCRLLLKYLNFESSWIWSQMSLLSGNVTYMGLGFFLLIVIVWKICLWRVWIRRSWYFWKELLICISFQKLLLSLETTFDKVHREWYYREVACKKTNSVCALKSFRFVIEKSTVSHGLRKEWHERSGIFQRQNLTLLLWDFRLRNTCSS